MTFDILSVFRRSLKKIRVSLKCDENNGFIFMVEPCILRLIVYYQQMHLMLILFNLKCLKQLNISQLLHVSVILPLRE
jgi:hypothetical protein